MSRFRQRLQRAEARIDRAFAEECPVLLIIGQEQRPVTAIFENPDALVRVTGGGEIQDTAPAISLHTAAVTGLAKKSQVVINGNSWWVTHIGSDEDGRTRVRLAHGKPGRPAPEIDEWS